jgi:Leucine-rich repeat (LRR) protein
MLRITTECLNNMDNDISDDDPDNELKSALTKVYNSVRFEKNLHENCSYCKSEISNHTHYFCQTCLDKDNIEFCICDKCVYIYKDHDSNHELILCRDHIYKNTNINNFDCNSYNYDQTHFILAPKILSRRGSLNNFFVNNSHINNKNSLSSGNSSSPDESKSGSSSESGKVLYLIKPKKLQTRTKNDIEEDDNFNTSNSSTPKLVEDESELDFHSEKKYTDCNIFNAELCVGSKIKKRRVSLKKSDETFYSALDYYRESHDTKLFFDKLMIGNSEVFFSEIQKDEFKKTELLSISENFLSRIDSNIFLLINIRELNIEKNNIKKIPEEIGDMTNLISLNIGYNLLVDLPYNMVKLINLHTLIADYNDFRQIPPVITEMAELKILYIEGNPNITSFPPEEKTETMKDLEIHIDNNQILMDKITKNSNLKIKWNCNYPVQILNKLYLGSYRTTLNEYVYTNLNISVVYTIGRDMTPLILQDMEHKIYIIDDFDTSYINFDILNSIHDHIRNGNTCLVHCQMGISRSATIVIAYLMKYCQMKLRDAYMNVFNKKKDINPNNGFLCQLNKLNKELYPEEEIFIKPLKP